MDIGTKNSSTKKPSIRFLMSPPTLKVLASNEMALVICRDCIRRREVDEEDEWDFWNFHLFIEDVESFVPEGIPELTRMVQNRLHNPVSRSIDQWYAHHKTYVFFDGDLFAVMPELIDYFMLKPDGTISFLQTAKNLIISDKLNVVEKFRLACLNCMEDDIERLLHSIPADQVLKERTYDEKHAMTRYWILYKGKGNLQRSTSALYHPTLERMEMTTIEYFWSSLSEDAQVTLATKLFSKGVSSEILFSKLNEKQLRKILKDVSLVRKICAKLVNDYRECEYFELGVWNYITHFISSRQFMNIIVELVDTSFSSCNFDLLLREIWTITPHQLKNTIVEISSSACLIFDALHSNVERRQFSNGDMTFFVALLADLSFEKRNALWLKYWPDLIRGTLACLEKIMKLCLNNDDEIIQFKERQMMCFDKIEDFCIAFVRKYPMSMAELGKYLKFCSSNVHYVSCVKRQILASSEIQSAIVDRVCVESFIELDEFIDDAFFDKKDARSYKRSLILPSDKMQEVYSEVDKAKLGVSWI